MSVGSFEQVRQDAQLDLAVVRAEQQVARLGHEGLADAPALRGADRDVLQVRVGDAEAPGGRHRLVEATRGCVPSRGFTSWGSAST